MKSPGVKNTHNQHNQPTLFSVSIFQSPEEFIAIYLAIQSDEKQLTKHAAKYLGQLLCRTKSPPIALTYTKEFLLMESEAQIQLATIRFISQLSDLSAGKSMQSSLSLIIDNSSFLTELRHNLTHRVMVRGLVIQRGKQMILKELKNKYWRVMFEKVLGTYWISSQKVEEEFEQIMVAVSRAKDCKQEEGVKKKIRRSRVYKDYERYLQEQEQNRLSREYLFKKCASNYQFKSLIRPYIIRKLLPQILTRIQNSSQKIQDMMNIGQQLQEALLQGLNQRAEEPISSSRCTILLSTLLQIIVSLPAQQSQSNFSKNRQILSLMIVGVICFMQKSGTNCQPNQNQKKQLLTQCFNSPIVLKKLKQLYLLQSIQEFASILEALPEEIFASLKVFWDHKGITFNRSSKFLS